MYFSSYQDRTAALVIRCVLMPLPFSARGRVVPSFLVFAGYFLQHKKLLDFSTVHCCCSPVHCGHRDVHGVQVPDQRDAGTVYGGCITPPRW